ncbi:MAG: hypothetical protein MJY79_00520, partial [Bacteroidaceae bacterium]|nr:hypothetical protein [Bacteroidaceae bacterium]
AEVRSSEDAPRLLTAAEGMNTNGSLVNGTLETFYINSVSTVLGYAGINWAVYGSYSNINDTVYYHHSRIDHQMVGWTAGVSAYAPLIYRTGLEDMSGSDHTLFRMYVWIGPYDMVPNEYDIWEGLSVGTTRINDTSYTRLKKQFILIDKYHGVSEIQ